jgi:hypothetical protein
MSRPIDGDGTNKLSKPAAFVTPADPEIAVAAHHPTVSAMAESRRNIVDKLLISASLVHRYTGSNCETSHRPPTLSRLTRTLDVL